MTRNAGIAAMLALVATAASPPSTGPIGFREPIVGLRIADPAGFERLPGDVVRRCPGLSNANYRHDLWILARSGDVIVASGRHVPLRPDLDDTEGDAGVVMRVDDRACVLLGPARELFAAPSDYAPDVDAAQASALAVDAAARYVAAHRGASRLCAAMRRQGRRTSDLPATLRERFSRAAPCLRRGAADRTPPPR